MLAVDVIPHLKNYYGFIGAYGSRVANFIASKADLIISLGSRMDIRQVGANRNNFAPNATIVRIDIDKTELMYPIHDDLLICMDLKCALDSLNLLTYKVNKQWLNICDDIKEKLSSENELLIYQWIKEISQHQPDNITICTDVGQNQVWIAQSFKFKKHQKALFSGNLGTMGYAIPSALGAYYATKLPVLCFCGDGGLKMSMSELITIVKRNFPITIVLINNESLGMITQFQEMYFKGNYAGTTESGGYYNTDYLTYAKIIGMRTKRITDENLSDCICSDKYPQFFEIKLTFPTHICPKLEYGKPNQDQTPLLSRELYNYINNL